MNYCTITAQAKKTKRLKIQQKQSTTAFEIADTTSHDFFIEGPGNGFSYKVTLETATSPAWFAIASLSKMADFGKDSSLINLANAYFANSVAAYLIERDSAAIRKFVAQNAGTSLYSKVFDKNKLSQRLDAVITKLENLQKADGSWQNENLTSYVASSIGRVENMNIHGPYQDRMQNTWIKATLYSDALWKARYDSIAARKLDDGHEDLLDDRVVSYFYSRSFSKVPLQTLYQKGVTFWERMAGSYWQKLDIMQKAMLISTFHRMAENNLAQEIYISISKEAIVTADRIIWDKGNTSETYWYESAASRQAMVSEAFKLMREPKNRMELIALGLLATREFDGWPDSKACADACNALLCYDIKPSGLTKEYTMHTYDDKAALHCTFTGYGSFVKTIEKEIRKPGEVSVARTLSMQQPAHDKLWGIISFETLK